MSIANEITRIQSAKTDIRTAIELKGVTVPSSATIDTYDTYVSQISVGGNPILKSIDVEDFTGTTFNDARSYVTNATIPSGVTSIGNNAFQGCSGLTSIDISSSVTSIGENAFQNCYGLTSVTIPNSVTSIGGWAFAYCRSLTSIDIPSGVTTIGNRLFYGCTSLTSVTIPDGVTSIGQNTFQNCTGLTSIDIPSGVTSIGMSAFYECSGLTSITVLATTPPTLGGSAFNSTNNCPIYVPAGSVDAYKAASVWSNYADRIQAIPSPTPTGQTWVTITAGNVIPAGSYEDLRISSATTIDDGSYMSILVYDISDPHPYLTFGSLCTQKQCIEYDCLEEDVLTRECIEYDETQCLDEECVSYEEGYANTSSAEFFPDSEETLTSFTFTDGYWNMGISFESDGINAPFDVEVLPSSNS